MISYPVKENPIGSAVSDRQTHILLIYYKDVNLWCNIQVIDWNVD